MKQDNVEIIRIIFHFHISMAFIILENLLRCILVLHQSKKYETHYTMQSKNIINFYSYDCTRTLT